MKEEDIDKIFKQGLQDYEAPVFESDWENFQRLRSSKANFWWKYFLPLLLAIVLVSGASYLYFADSSEKAGNQVNVGNNGNAEKASAGKTPSNGGDSKLSDDESMEDNEYRDSVLYVAGDSLNRGDLAKMEDEKLVDREHGTAVFEEPKIKEADADHRGQKKTDINRQDTGNSNNKLVDSTVAKTEVRPDAHDRTVGNQAKNEDSGHNSIVQGTGDAASGSKVEYSSASVNQKGNSENLPVSDKPFDRTDVDANEKNTLIYAFQPVYMGSLPAHSIPVEWDENSFNAEKVPISVIRNNHQIGIYFGVEQNNILGTSPMVGLVSSWNIHRWKLGIGVGYQRSGALNWNQESRRTIYGFDRYEASATLQTRSVDLLSVPIIVSRQIGGVSSLFLGITPSILVNARQELLISDDSNLTNFEPETGYLYKTEAPEIIYFISGGYTHHLTTWWSLDIGGNYTFQEWRTTNKVPVGAFIRTHIRIR